MGRGMQIKLETDRKQERVIRAGTDEGRCHWDRGSGQGDAHCPFPSPGHRVQALLPKF